MKHIHMVILVAFITTNSFAMNYKTVKSATDLFTYKIPKDWEKIEQPNQVTIEAFQYRNQDGSFLLITSYDLMKVLGLSPKDHPREAYSFKYMNESRLNPYKEIFMEKYLDTLNFKDASIIGITKQEINGSVCLIGKYEFTSGQTIFYHEKYDFLEKGYHTTFTFHYEANKKENIYPVLIDIVNSIIYKK